MAYTKQTFTSGQTLKASDLNTMSQGIVDKQDKLVSGTNIKTVNGQSLLGSGNIVISGGAVDAGLSSISANPVQNKVIYNELVKKANLDDVYVTVETQTASANGVAIMALSDEGIAVASVDEYSYVYPNATKGYQGEAVSVTPSLEQPIYVTAVTVACAATKCEFAIYEYVKKYPGNAANKEYTLTKVRSCGIVDCNTTNKEATISFPSGEYVDVNQLMVACGNTKGMGFGVKDENNSNPMYYYVTNIFEADAGTGFDTAIPGDWSGVFTTTYSYEQPSGDAVITYTVTNNLSNASNSNTSTIVNKGESYIATITANDGYVLDVVTVIMGGVDVTSSVYSNGSIVIDNVTGAIDIVATTTATSTGTSYTITNSLTNAVNSNSATSIIEGATYLATITASVGYTLSSVIVTMGGVNVTSSVYSNGTINIPSVTGNIVITVKTIAESTGSGTKRKIKEVIPEMLSDITSLKTMVSNIGSSNSRSARKPVNKYFVLTVDDVERSFFNIADRLIAIGFYPALAMKMESVNAGAITWDELRSLQDMGFEIAFHGMLHSHTPAGGAPNYDEVMIADIAQYKALCNDNGIDLVGYCGPNHYALPVGAFKEFEWARSASGTTSYGWDSHRLSDSFASIQAGTSFDWAYAPSEETIASMIAKADDLQDNQYLTPMCHSQNIVANIESYMRVFNGWIEKGLTPMRCRDAVKQSLWECGGIGNNSTFEVQAGTASNPYWVVAGNGTVRTNEGA